MCYWCRYNCPCTWTAVYFDKAKHNHGGSAKLYTKWLNSAQLMTLGCPETKVIAPEACQTPLGITDAYLTSKTRGPQPRSNRKGIHMGLILHPPHWQMQIGTCETWGISLTDRAAGNKDVSGITHSWTNEIVNLGEQTHRQRFTCDTQWTGLEIHVHKH